MTPKKASAEEHTILIPYKEEWKLNAEEEDEFLNPSFDSPLRRTSSFNATFNLVATIVGGGVLSLPQAYAKAGIALCTLLLIVSAVITEFSLYLLCSCARRSKSKSYMEIVKYAFGDVAEFWMTCMMWVYMSGVLIAFYVLMLGIFSPLLKVFLETIHVFDSMQMMNLDGGPYFDRCLLAVILMFMMPFILKHDLYALRHICYVGFCSVCVIICSMSIRAFQRNFEHELLNYPTRPEIKYYSTDSSDVLFAFPICVLSFFCSQNLVEVHSSLNRPTRKRVRKVLRTSIIATFFLFLCFACAGYFFAYSDCKDNIFLNFDPSDPLIIVGRLSMGITLMFATPVAFVPCREAFLNIFRQFEHLKNKKSSNRIHNVMSDREALMKTAVNKQRYSSLSSDEEGNYQLHSCDEVPLYESSLVAHILSTMFILTLTFLVAVAVPGVAVVWDVLGSSMALIIGFIVPCACYLKIRWGKGWRLLNLGAAVLLVFSVVASIVCTTHTLSEIK